MKKTMNLKNIGAKTEPWLREIGVHGLEDLNRIGSVEAYKRLKSRYPDKINLNALYALEAALWNIHWLELAPEFKEQLRRDSE
ncbi:TfoX/Sxy family protein [Paenibacillus mesophilus]|uniref:TfoX/Sxy family DNA transformation protein n=1 Tax=Paenibacillus mesophilus TaxID=2582849 RepID=UPI00110F1E40|nr:TfoX/Sxy family DNA transformation protein [Paenibacillus mesophilus]TMV51512.1 TfoX/Sxy family protein [Paenibacillus mesophilus]